MSAFPVSSASLSSIVLPSFEDGISNTKSDVKRNTMKFNASIWGDQFLTYDEV